MGLLDRFRRVRAGRSAVSGGRDVETRSLREWVRTHAGVEGFVEPETTVTDVTAVLVAADGEWTRRVVGEGGGGRLARDLNIPVYDVERTGYPQRMRDYDALRRIVRKRAGERELGEP
ncbi:oxidoreductase [Nocardia sp. NPDC004568]|uniref:oxidoreductase n=1 Tax=Nocardia sp. NPDC004568 TaxID=3154551 RepID=UPI0033A47245